MKLLKGVRDKAQAFFAAKQAGAARELAQHKSGGPANTYITAKERDLRKKRRKIAKQSKIRNRA